MKNKNNIKEQVQEALIIANNDIKSIDDYIKNSKPNVIMLILPKLVKENKIKRNCDLSHINDIESVYALDYNSFKKINSHGIKLSIHNLNLCLLKAIKDEDLNYINMLVKQDVKIFNNVTEHYLNNSSIYTIKDKKTPFATNMVLKHFSLIPDEQKKEKLEIILKNTLKQKQWSLYDEIIDLLVKDKISFLDKNIQSFSKIITRAEEVDYKNFLNLLINKKLNRKYEQFLFKEAVLNANDKLLNILLENKFTPKTYLKSKAFVNIYNNGSLVENELMKNKILKVNKQLNSIYNVDVLEKKLESKLDTSQIKKKKI